jgi:spore coat polysaccharide biosynthesis predicted glycosyltransferase SpsG
MRCLRIARYLKTEKIESIFVRRGPRDAASDEFPTTWLSFASISGEQESLGHGLAGIDAQKRDARETITETTTGSRERIAVFVDHYALGRAWEAEIRDECSLLVAIDDLANREHLCDILIDSAPLPDNRYDRLVPKECVRLLGPEYALLAPQGLPSTRPTRSKQDKPRIIATFGGSNDSRALSFLVKALKDPRLQDVECTLVHRNAIPAGLESDLAELEVEVHGWTTDLSKFLRQADVCVGTAGSTVFDCLAVGLPSVVLATADNQIAFAKAWHDLKMVKFVGTLQELSTGKLADAIVDAATDTKWRTMVNTSGPRYVDGRGVSRLWQTLLATEL